MSKSWKQNETTSFLAHLPHGYANSRPRGLLALHLIVTDKLRNYYEFQRITFRFRKKHRDDEIAASFQSSITSTAKRTTATTVHWRYLRPHQGAGRWGGTVFRVKVVSSILVG